MLMRPEMVVMSLEDGKREFVSQGIQGPRKVGKVWETNLQEMLPSPWEA